MEEMINVLESTSLFRGLSEEEISSSIKFLKITKEKFDKNNLVFEQGKPIKKIGLLYSGKLNIIKEDYWGNRVILSKLTKGAIFGEVISFSGSTRNFVNVEVAEDAEVLFLNFHLLIASNSEECSYREKLILNMFSILIKKSLVLTEKIEHITKKTVREKILSYLSSSAFHFQSNEFEIPFNRQELADYLSIERTALSRELGNMQNEGIINFEGNKFLLKKQS